MDYHDVLDEVESAEQALGLDASDLDESELQIGSPVAGAMMPLSDRAAAERR